MSHSAYTKDIFDCTVCGLTDGQQVLLNHICPTNPKNKSFSKIQKFISNKINLYNANWQGFILGSKPNNINSPMSSKLFEQFEKLLKNYEIPYSKFKGGVFENHCAYSSSKDEWIIGNCLISENMKATYKNPMMILRKIFDEVEIAPCDEVSW